MHRLLIVILYILPVFISAQFRIDKDRLSSSYVLTENRVNYRNVLHQKVDSFLTLKPAPGNEKSWISLFWELELTCFTGEDVDTLIDRCMDYFPEAGIKFQRAIIEAVNTLTPGKYTKEIFNLLQTTSNVQVFGAASVYLFKQEFCDSDTIITILNQQFPAFESDDVLQFLYNDLVNLKSKKQNTPNLGDLLSHDFQPGKTIIYSLQRSDRAHPGITIIKGPDGKFVRNADSTVFFVKQLAYATSGFPGYLSQGNTPQGIFSVVGSYVSPTESIGPTANVITRIPFEVSTDIYYHGKHSSNRWNLDDYLSLLPESWRNYLAVREAFFAGKTGRRLIVMHGSTDDLTFYKDQPYYPLTPSKGCLTTTEVWDEETGRCIRSDQVKLMYAFYSTGQLKGFLAVVNINDKQEPVTLQEILPVILAVEK